MRRPIQLVLSEVRGLLGVGNDPEPAVVMDCIAVCGPANVIGVDSTVVAAGVDPLEAGILEAATALCRHRRWQTSNDVSMPLPSSGEVAAELERLADVVRRGAAESIRARAQHRLSLDIETIDLDAWTHHPQ